MEEVIKLIKPDIVIDYHNKIPKKIAFLVDHWSFRGTNRVLFDNADKNEIILNNFSYIVAPKKLDNRNNLGVLFKFMERFERFYLYNSLEDLEKYLDDNYIEFLYIIKGGDKCEISNYFEDKKHPIKLLIHCVYHCKDPHGYRYVAVSKQVSEVI